MSFKNITQPLDLEYFSAAMLGPVEVEQALDCKTIPWTPESQAVIRSILLNHRDNSELVGFQFSRDITQPEIGVHFSFAAVYGEHSDSKRFILPSPAEADNQDFPGWDVDSVTDWYPEASEQYLGICKNCGSEREQCEPDADGYECLDCGENAVYGSDNVLIHFA